MSKQELNACLKYFYTSAREKDGTYYKCSSTKSIRSFLKLEQNLANPKAEILIKQLFHSRLLDEIGYSQRWLFTISYPTRAHGIIVKYPSPDFVSLDQLYSMRTRRHYSVGYK